MQELAKLRQKLSDKEIIKNAGVTFGSLRGYLRGDNLKTQKPPKSIILYILGVALQMERWAKEQLDDNQ